MYVHVYVCRILKQSKHTCACHTLKTKRTEKMLEMKDKIKEITLHKTVMGIDGTELIHRIKQGMRSERSYM